MLKYFFSPFGRIGRLSFFLGGVLGVLLLSYFLFTIGELILQILARAGVTHAMDLTQFEENETTLNILRKMVTAGDWAQIFVFGVLYLSLIWVQICLGCKRLRDMNWPIWIVIIPIAPYAIGMIEGINDVVYLGTFAVSIIVLLVMTFYPSKFEE